MHGTEEASNDRRVRVRIIHGLNMNSHTYCKNLQVIKTKHYAHAPRGGRLVGKEHRSSPTATHKEGNQRNTSCFKFVTQWLPYVHATGLANLNTSISQFHNYSTSMTLISPPLYRSNISYSTIYKFYVGFYD